MSAYEELLQLISNLDPRFRVLEKNTEDCLGQVLRQDVKADMPMPPFNKAAVDGFACRMEDLEDELELLETVAAGQLPLYKVGRKQCSKIMTGAAVPEGADCVFMIEDAVFPAPGRVRCNNPASKKNICYLGEDYRPGDILLKSGSLLRADHLAVIASAGLTKVAVSEQPRITLIVTGSELVEFSNKPEHGKIRNSNAIQLISLLEKMNLQVSYTGLVRDDYGILLETFREALSKNTGGAAVGDFDLVPGLLADEGFRTLWTRTGLKPGNPMSFAIKEDKYVFGLSGNPVSSFVQFEFLVKPVLYNLLGTRYRPFRIRAIMGEDFFRKNASRTGIIPVKVSAEGEIRTLPFNGSAHINALPEADALMEIEEGKKEIKKGEPVYVRPL